MPLISLITVIAKIINAEVECNVNHAMHLWLNILKPMEFQICAILVALVDIKPARVRLICDLLFEDHE